MKAYIHRFRERTRWWYTRRLVHWRFRQMKRKSPQSFRQNLGIFLLTNIPHPEIDCGFGDTVDDWEELQDLGTRYCLVPSARGYSCRACCVRQAHIDARRCTELLGQLKDAKSEIDRLRRRLVQVA